MITKIAPLLRSVNPLASATKTQVQKDPKDLKQSTWTSPSSTTVSNHHFNSHFFIREVKLHPTYVISQIEKIIDGNNSLLLANHQNVNSNADLNTLISTIRGLINSLIIKDVESIRGIATLLQSTSATIPLWFELLERASRLQGRS